MTTNANRVTQKKERRSQSDGCQSLTDVFLGVKLTPNVFHQLGEFK